VLIKAFLASRCHHLLKTFWALCDEQPRDGTVIWTSPWGEKFVTHPGSALIFPGLCAPTGPLPVPTPTPGIRRGPRQDRDDAPSHPHPSPNHSAKILAECRANHQRRTNPTPPHIHIEHIEYLDTFTNAHGTDPPPF
jgi:hypothetical protein